MVYLQCVVKRPPAIGAQRVIAEVTDRYGAREQVIVDETFLTKRAGQSFLPVWFISRDQDMVQVELPQEAASGANRIWVHVGDIFVTNEQQLQGVPA